MRILVVGLGSMGRRRLRNLTHLGGHELAGLELLDARREEVGREAGIPVFGSLEEALAWGPQALVISTPPDQHAQYALAAAERGLHFFTEASVVTTGMEEVIAVARGKDIVAAPSCTMRFHPACAKLRELIAAGAIGKPLTFTHHVGQWLPDWHPWEDYRTFYVAKRETGAAREIVPFELNWLTQLFGPVTELNAFVSKLSSLEADIDDIYSTLLGFESGVQGSMTIEVISRPAIRLARIIGEEGTLQWDWNGRRVLQHSAGQSEEWLEHPDPPPVQGPGGEWVAENMYIEEMAGFVGAIEGGEPWPLSLEDDHRLLLTLEALEDASRESRQPFSK
jgi:predicted dehydrogenase